MQAGVQGVNPSDPRLHALLDIGVTSDEIGQIAVEAVRKGRGWAWLLATAQGRRADAAALAKAGAAMQQAPAPRSNEDVERYARERRELDERTPEQLEAARKVREAVMAGLRGGAGQQRAGGAA